MQMFPDDPGFKKLSFSNIKKIPHATHVNQGCPRETTNIIYNTMNSYYNILHILDI
jgi:hypothetical protein